MGETTIPALAPAHQQLIDASGISADVATARGYITVNRKSALRDRGFGENQRSVPALVIPLYNV